MNNGSIQKTQFDDSLISEPALSENLSSMLESPISSLVINDREESRELELFEVQQSKIRISKRNRIMKQHFNIDDCNDSYTTCFSQENFERLVESHMNNKSTHDPGLKLDPGSCFLWYILPKHAFKYVISDFEMKKCKNVFKNMLEKLPNCHEALFGLGKLLAHQGLNEKARKYIQKALIINPSDKLYKLWNLVLQNKQFKNRNEAFSACSLAKSLFSEYPSQLEVLWERMRLGFSRLVECPRDLELPQVTAARIRDVDDYYGYLAWSEVFMNDNLKEKGVHVLLELIRCFSYRPEAYLRLWEHYTKTGKNAEALEVAIECFLKVIDYPEYSSIITLNLAKSNFLSGFTVKALELLQQKHTERPTFSVYLYYYGKICVKACQDVYLPVGIGALNEVLRNCDKSRIAKINYWLFIAYKRYNENSKAVKCLTAALGKIKSAKKLEFLKSEFKVFSRFISQLQIAENWLEDKKDEKFEKFKQICNEIKSFDREEGHVLISKGLWKIGNELEAIESLQSFLSTCPKPNGYFLLLKYLFMKEDHIKAHNESKIMLKKCSDSPIQIWIQSHIMHSYSLMHRTKFTKAILLLKCLGKIFPFVPYTYIPYIHQLRKAACIEDLYDSAKRAMDSSVNYTETSFQLDNFLKENYIFPKTQVKTSNQEACYLMIQEETILTEESNSISYKEISLTDVFYNYINSKTSSIKSINSERLENIMKTCEENNFVGYSISSNPKFLYAIGKISAYSGCFVEDGLCAIEDYIKIIQGSQEVKEVLKAMVIKSGLLRWLGDCSSARGVLVEVLGESRKLKMWDMESRVLEILKGFS